MIPRLIYSFHDLERERCASNRKSIFSRLAAYEDTNDAERLSVDPTMRQVVGGRATERTAASSPPEEKGCWSTKWRQNTSCAGQKRMADWKNVMQIRGAGRKSRKPSTLVVGMKPYGKCQVSVSTPRLPRSVIEKRISALEATGIRNI